MEKKDRLLKHLRWDFDMLKTIPTQTCFRANLLSIFCCRRSLY